MSDAFEKADFYGFEDDEFLSCATPEERIIEQLDTQIDPSEPLGPQISEMGDVEVFAFVRREVDLRFCEREASSAIERFSENYGDEYGHPDGGDRFDEGALAAAEAEIAAALRKLVATKPPFACERVARRVYTPTDVLAIARKRWPEPAEPTP